MARPRSKPSLISLPEVLIIKIATWLNIRDMGRLRSIVRSPAWTSEHLWSAILKRDHPAPLRSTLEGLPSELVVFLLLLTRGEELPAIELMMLSLHGSARMVSLYLEARPVIRDDEIICSAVLMLAERLGKLDTISVLLSETAADDDTGYRVYRDALKYFKDNGQPFTLPGNNWQWMRRDEAAARDDLDRARGSWKASKRYEEKVRGKAARRASDEKWGLREGKCTSSQNWEDSLLKEFEARHRHRARYNAKIERLAYGSQRAREAVATRAALAKEKREILKFINLLYNYIYFLYNPLACRG